MSQEKPPAAPGCAEELAAVRGKGKWWKTAALVLGLLLLALAAGGYYFYRRVMQAQAVLEQVMRTAGQPQAVQPAAGEAAPPQELPLAVQPRQSSLMAISLPGGAGAGEEGDGPAPDYGAMSPAEAKKTLDALMKYSDRPLVKEFLADLAKDPEFVKAQAAREKGDPLQMIKHMQNSAGLQRLVMKYARRPEFIPLAQEIMRDPKLRGLLGTMPGGEPGMPAPPDGQSGGVTRVQGISRAEADRQARERERAASSDADQDGELTFNAGAIGGAPAPAPKAKPAQPPPPVDSGR